MNRGVIAAAMLLLGSAGQAFAADATKDSRPVCPVKGATETREAFHDRVYGYCEIRWNDLVARNATGGQTHDEFIRKCPRKCGYAEGGDTAAAGAGGGVNSTQVGYVVGGLALVGGIAGGIAASTGSGGGAPASP